MIRKTSFGGIFVVFAAQCALANLAQNVFEKIELPALSMTVNGVAVHGKLLSGLIAYENPDKTYGLLVDEQKINPRELFHLIRSEDHPTSFEASPLRTSSSSFSPSSDSRALASPLELNSPQKNIEVSLASTLNDAHEYRREVSPEFYCVQRITHNRLTSTGLSQHYHCHIQAESSIENVELALVVPSPEN